MTEKWRKLIIPDTKPVEGLGEATPPRSERKCLTCGEYHIAHRPDSGWAWQWSAGRKGHDEHPLRMESEADALKDRVKRYDTVWGELVAHHDEWKSQAQTLATRVQKQNDVIAELTAALKKIATTSQQEASNDPENLILIAQEVLVRDCGNCGDDGEEPSNNCPTCRGTGFKCQK